MSLPLRDTFYLLFRFYGWIWWKTLGKYQAFLKPIHLNKPPRQQCVVGLGQRDVFREWILSWQWDKGHEPSPCLAALGQNSDHALGTEHNQEPSPIWPVHVDVWQKPTQYCKAVILQLKISVYKKKKKNRIKQHRQKNKRTQSLPLRKLEANWRGSYMETDHFKNSW